jgi:hypothetical protein
MRLRFWRRGNKKRGADSSLARNAQVQKEESTPIPAWLATAGAKEILALQHLIGNQALLSILAANRNAVNSRRVPK